VHFFEHANVFEAAVGRFPLCAFCAAPVVAKKDHVQGNACKCIESESHLHVCGLVWLPLILVTEWRAVSVCMCEITKLDQQHIFHISFAHTRIGPSVGRRDSLVHSLCIYTYVSEHPASRCLQMYAAAAPAHKA
jgi:hypothetical protein